MTDTPLQFHGATSEIRHFDSFEEISELFARPPRVLSFGCSTGEELVTLGRVFPDSEIFGAEVVPERIEQARKLSGREVAPLPQLKGDFDLITAMSVFCRWPREAGTLPYDDFVKSVREVAKRIRVGGVLVIYNASYNPSKVLPKTRFKKLDQFTIRPASFVDVLDGGSGDGVFQRIK